MTRITKAYRFRVYDDTGSTPEFQFWSDQGDFASLPQVPGQFLLVGRSTSASVPFDVHLVDRNGVVSRALRTSGGRYAWAHRYCDLSVSVDDGALSVIAGGRVRDVDLDESMGGYLVGVEDDRSFARDLEIFTEADTTLLFPAGPRYQYGAIDRRTTVRAVVTGTYTHTATGQDFIKVALVGVSEWNHKALDYVIGDVKQVAFPGLAQGANADEGNFEHVRIRIDGCVREIVTFDSTVDLDGGGLPFLIPATTHVESLRDLRAEKPESLPGKTPGGIWLPVGTADSGCNTWPTTPPSVGDEFGTVDDPVYLFTVGQPPTEDMPLHVGVYDPSNTHPYRGSTPEGIHPFALLKQLLDEQGVRYDTTAIQGLIDNPAYRSYRRRVTQSMTLWEFATELFEQYIVGDFVDETGAIAPVDLTLPRFDASGTYESTEDRHAGEGRWRIRSREMINVVRGTWFEERAVFTSGNDNPVDGIIETPRPLVREYDNLTQAGRYELAVTFHGLHHGWWGPAMINRLADEAFARFGDGAQYFEVNGLHAADAVAGGQVIQITDERLPNFGEATGRGGTRVVQVLRVHRTPEGSNLLCLDIGPDAQPLSAPTITGVAQNATIPKHALDVSWSGLSIVTGAKGLLEYAVSALEPAADSNLWTPATVVSGASGTATIYQLPSTAVLWFRLRAIAPHKLGSDWSSAVSGTTESLSAVTGLATSGLDGLRTAIVWTSGNRGYQVEIRLDDQPSGSAVLEHLAYLDPGTERFQLLPLVKSTTYTVGVRHVDLYGGIGPEATLEFTTLGTANTWPTPLGLRIAQAAAVAP